ncbi:MAG: SET domain-containing protein-lysine N-methyltransferase [Candidatus Tectomicrobia bacterium]|nr:SET domain-containing protein-lysine N-methyltransferase [Candidatus Tectomicrobia bacterium]
MATDYRSRHPLVSFRRSPIQGTGGFAKIDIRRGKRIVEYAGPRISQDEAERLIEQGNAYIFTLNDEVAINGWMRWNTARFLNHSCAPNCESRIVQERVWIYALRSIQAGEELTYNYGYGLDDAEVDRCRCGAPTCVGYMVAEEHFATVGNRHGG